MRSPESKGVSLLIALRPKGENGYDEEQSREARPSSFERAAEIVRGALDDKEAFAEALKAAIEICVRRLMDEGDAEK